MIIDTTPTNTERDFQDVLIISERVAKMSYTHSYYGPWLGKDENGEYYVTDERAMILNMTQGKVDIAAEKNDDS